MTMYEKFKKLDIDFSQLDLEQRDTHSDYFCTPKGAKVIGWAGVDGIHCCFVKGFGETVFTVSPMNPRGHYVHPVAKSFEDFLRLVLACGGMAAVEQAWMWNRGEFDAFLETYPPDDKQKAVLDALRDKLSLTPMDDPYGYIKAVQSSFDYGKIPYSKEYYDTVPDEPETEEPPRRPEWRVYFENGFSSYHRGHDKPGIEISISKTFAWGGRTWHIPAVYACGKGLVVDFCVEVDPAAHWAFVEKWRPWWEGDKPLTPEEEEQQAAENPMTVDFDARALANGRELRPSSGSGFGWTPMSLRLEYEQGAYHRQDWEAIWLMEHYGLDAELGWVFWRQSFPWATKTRPTLNTLVLSLEQRPISVPGPRFTVSKAGDTVPFMHPVTGEPYTLRVVEYENKEMDMSGLPGSWEYPNHCTAMSYTVEPELPRESLTVRDCGQGDSPRINVREQTVLAAIGGADGPAAACSVGIIGGADGPTAIILADRKSEHPQTVCSALRFEAPKQIEWRMVFCQKTAEDMKIDLPLH